MRAKSANDRAPPLPWQVWAYRAAFVAVLATYYGIIVLAMRALQGHFGWSLWSTVLALVPTIVMSVFVVPLAAFARLPEHWLEQHRPLERWRRGLCPECGYALSRGEPESADALASWPTRCPECGATPRAPRSVELSSASFRAFAWMALVALFLGTAVAETLVQIDEHRFRREVAQARLRHPDTPYDRPRQWPGSFARLRWDPVRGFEADAPGVAPTRPTPSR